MEVPFWDSIEEYWRDELMNKKETEILVELVTDIKWIRTVLAEFKVECNTHFGVLNGSMENHSRRIQNNSTNIKWLRWVIGIGLAVIIGGMGIGFKLLGIY